MSACITIHVQPAVCDLFFYCYVFGCGLARTFYHINKIPHPLDLDVVVISIFPAACGYQLFIQTVDTEKQRLDFTFRIHKSSKFDLWLVSTPSQISTDKDQLD